MLNWLSAQIEKKKPQYFHKQHVCVFFTAEGIWVGLINRISISECEDDKMVPNPPVSPSRLTFSPDHGSPPARWMDARQTAAA